jgi:SAM-dependent methyltransferase
VSPSLTKKTNMNWRNKAYLQAALSHLPGGHQLNYLFRRHITKTIPASRSVQEADYLFAAQHLSAFRACGSVPIEDALFYEFGVGWDLMIPLSLYSLGVNRQIVTDLVRLLKPSLVILTTGAFPSLKLEPAPLRLPRLSCSSMESDELGRALQASYGINYRAPFDARSTGFPPNSIDYVTTTKVLSFIPPNVLREILRECGRILRPGGVMSVLIDYRDNYRHFDKSISVYNFLQYSDETWERRYNSPLFHQNRLRHCDYRRLFSEVGLQVVRDEPGYDGTIEAARERLANLQLSERFSAYNPDDLAPVRGIFVLRKGSAQ